MNGRLDDGQVWTFADFPHAMQRVGDQLDLLWKAERDFYTRSHDMRVAEFRLKEKEAGYLCVEGESLVNGKNAEIREAQLFRLTKPERLQVQEALKTLEEVRCNLSFQQWAMKANFAALALATALLTRQPDAEPEDA